MSSENEAGLGLPQMRGTMLTAKAGMGIENLKTVKHMLKHTKPDGF